MQPGADPGSARMGEAVALYERLLEAWNRRDPADFAALFSDSGIAIGFDGSEMHGEWAIEAELGRIFAHHQTAAYVAKVRSVRQLDAEVVLLHAVVGMTPPGSREVRAERNAIQMLVTVREEGRMRIALLQNTPAQFHGRPELAAQLTSELNAVARAGRTVVHDDLPPQ